MLKCPKAWDVNSLTVSNAVHSFSLCKVRLVHFVGRRNVLNLRNRGLARRKSQSNVIRLNFTHLSLLPHNIRSRFKDILQRTR